MASLRPRKRAAKSAAAIESGSLPGAIKGWVANEIAELETAEAAGIDEAQLSAAQEAEPGMGVRGDWLVGGGDEQTAGHAQMHDPLGF